jgi:Domain of unknown function (DUF6487)
MTADSQCPKCKGTMMQGYILELGDMLSATMWIEGRPEKSFFFGTKLRGREQHPIQSFRCAICGFLESYAVAAPKSDALHLPSDRPDE